MKIGFDLDGTLDRPPVLALLLALLNADHEIHIITGMFPESHAALQYDAKLFKLVRLGLATIETLEPDADEIKAAIKAKRSPVRQQRVVFKKNIVLHVITAVDKSYDREYRLIDIAFRKGAIIEQYGIQIMFDDSALYCENMPKMCGAQMVHVR